MPPYDLVIAPVLYMVKPGVAEKREAWTRAGGTFVTTFFSGLVDGNDLVYLGGYPGPLRKMLGIWAEEIDALSPQQTNSVVFDTPFGGLDGSYECRLLCDRIRAEGAQVLATYGEDFYAGEPAVTVNSFGQGKAYYLATALGQEALGLLLHKFCADAGIQSPLPGGPMQRVEVMPRVSPNGQTLLYMLNHNAHPVSVALPAGAHTDLLTGKTMDGTVELERHGVAILGAE